MKEYRIAVDLGTTTVEVAIIDGLGNIISTASFNNPQSLYGRDVINRIMTTTRDNKYILIMKNMFIDKLKECLNDLINKNSLEFNSFKAMCICGNTTMISILLEYDLKELGVFPFKHKLDKSIKTNSLKLFGDDFPLDINIYLSGCFSAFIGGDCLAGLMSLDDYIFKDKPKSILFMDLGTNGELVLYSDNKYYCTSTACGPAFESCCRSGNAYGSNLIDAITLGIKTGKISREGILKDDYLEDGIELMGIEITADILREILVAKAAISTGIKCLFNEARLNLNNVDVVYIAGGFGFHMNTLNATTIGLLPKELSGKIKIVGNASLKGAISLVNCPSKLDLLDGFKTNDVKLVQMANLPDYQEMLIENMNFKE